MPGASHSSTRWSYSRRGSRCSLTVATLPLEGFPGVEQVLPWHAVINEVELGFALQRAMAEYASAVACVVVAALLAFRVIADGVRLGENDAPGLFRPARPVAGGDARAASLRADFGSSMNQLKHAVLAVISVVAISDAP